MDEVPLETWEDAFDVAHRFRDYDSYGSEQRAANALRRRCPNLTKVEAQELFDASLRAYDSALGFIAGESKRLHAHQGNVAGLEEFDHVRDRICPSVPIQVWRDTLSWIWYWHHLR